MAALVLSSDMQCDNRVILKYLHCQLSQNTQAEYGGTHVIQALRQEVASLGYVVSSRISELYGETSSPFLFFKATQDPINWNNSDKSHAVLPRKTTEMP